MKMTETCVIPISCKTARKIVNAVKFCITGVAMVIIGYGIGNVAFLAVNLSQNVVTWMLCGLVCSLLAVLAYVIIQLGYDIKFTCIKE
jgi:hypothetical protein